MSDVKEYRLQRIADILEDADRRAAAIDGPVPDTVKLITQSDIEKIYGLANGLPEEEWKRAKVHFDNVRQQYQDLEGKSGVNTTMALRTVFDPLAKRYNSGERSEELFTEMMNVK